MPNQVLPVRTISQPERPFSPGFLVLSPFRSSYFIPDMELDPRIPKLTLVTTTVLMVTVTVEEVVRTMPVGTGSFMV